MGMIKMTKNEAKYKARMLSYSDEDGFETVYLSDVLKIIDEIQENVETDDDKE